jgi:hypothetical protein
MILLFKIKWLKNLIIVLGIKEKSKNVLALSILGFIFGKFYVLCITFFINHYHIPTFLLVNYKFCLWTFSSSLN